MTLEGNKFLIKEYKKMNLTDKEIEDFVKHNVTDHRMVKITSDIILTNVLFVFFALTLIQCCLCSLPCLWVKGCCCFKTCSYYKKKGTKDKKTGDIYVTLKNYKKFGKRSLNTVIEKRSNVELPKRTESIMLLGAIDNSAGLRSPMKAGRAMQDTIDDPYQLLDNSPEPRQMNPNRNKVSPE